MTQAVLLVDQLKRELKSRGITYAQLAKLIGMSEASVKRMFAQRMATQITPLVATSNSPTLSAVK